MKIISPEGFSWCFKCSAHKPTDEFGKGDRHNGLNSRCRPCNLKKNYEYVKRNHAKWCETRRKYYKNNKERILKAGKSYRQNSFSYRYGLLKKRSSTAAWPLIMTSSEFSQWYKSQKKECYYCDVKSPGWGYDGRFQEFSIDRKDSDLFYSTGNMCLSCMKCNVSKGNLFTELEFREIAQKYIKPKWMAKLQLAA